MGGGKGKEGREKGREGGFGNVGDHLAEIELPFRSMQNESFPSNSLRQRRNKQSTRSKPKASCSSIQKLPLTASASWHYGHGVEVGGTHPSTSTSTSLLVLGRGGGDQGRRPLVGGGEGANRNESGWVCPMDACAWR